MFTQRYIAATLTCNHLQLLRIYDSEDGVYCNFFIIIGRRACRKATFTWDRGHPHSASRNPKHPKPLQGGPTPAQVRMFPDFGVLGYRRYDSSDREEVLSIAMSN